LYNPGAYQEVRLLPLFSSSPSSTPSSAPPSLSPGPPGCEGALSEVSTEGDASYEGGHV
jgi:hypothetical protein